LGAYLLPIPFFQKRHKLVWYVLGGYAILTIVLWAIIGEHTFSTLAGQVGIFAKIAELCCSASCGPTARVHSHAYPAPGLLSDY